MGGVCPTLNRDAGRFIVIIMEAEDVEDDLMLWGCETAQTLDASYFKGPGARNGKEREIIAQEPTMLSDRKGHNSITQNGTATTLTAQEKERPMIGMSSVVRRLTPLECERLQGYPDGWTLIGDPEEVEVKDYDTEWVPGGECKYECLSDARQEYLEAFLNDETDDDEAYFDPKEYGFVEKKTLIGSHKEIQYFYTDTNGKRRRCADSNRYKALGNSIALPFWQWMARRICAQYERPVTMASLFDGIGGFPLVFSRCGATPVWASEIEEFPMAVTRVHFPEEDDQ